MADYNFDDVLPVMIEQGGLIELSLVSKRGYEAALFVEEKPLTVNTWLEAYLANHPPTLPLNLQIYPDDMVVQLPPEIPHLAQVALPQLYRQGRPTLLRKLLESTPAYLRSMAGFSCFHTSLVNRTNRAAHIPGLESRMIECAETFIEFGIYPQGFYPNQTAAAQARAARLEELATFWESAVFPGAEVD